MKTLHQNSLSRGNRIEFLTVPVNIKPLRFNAPRGFRYPRTEPMPGARIGPAFNSSHSEK